MARLNSKIVKATRRAKRVRKKLRDSGKPRLTVFRSSRYIYAQVIDDGHHQTMVEANSMKAVRGGQLKVGGNIEAAKLIGQEIAGRALEAGIEKVVFDRGPYKYHGRVQKALAEAARGAGLKF